MGVPDWYFAGGRPCWDEERFLSMEMPGPFLWEGPDGRRLYSFYMLHGMRNAVDPWFTPYETLAAELGEFERLGYRYDNIPFMVNGGPGDNSPPSMHFAELTRS